ncbi:MAG: hypothetical protein N5P05_000285 [Chroococcopsis gigantea SAG 12.99]|jgi:protein O-GlcNAc transferase|nr:hypothetical protein [Chroococcopsis gigantea SAG 12.99]
MEVDRLINEAREDFSRGNYKRALNILVKACKVEPGHDIAQTNLSYLAYLNGDIALAISAGKIAVSLNPDRAEAHMNLGNALRVQGDVEEAIQCLQTAVAKNSQLAEAWSNLNIAYLDHGEIKLAINAGKQALLLNNRLIHAYNNLALTLQQAGDAITARQLLKIAIDLEPGSMFTHDNYLMNLQYLTNVNSREILNSSIRFGQILGHNTNQHNRVLNKNKKIRIGYVSADFRCHPVGFFLLPVLLEHDRNRFEIFIYGNQQVSDNITQQFKAGVDYWRNISNSSDEEVLETIKGDRIDILVDLSGHTAGNRLGVFALRAAPVQVSWLGYFASTGLTNMDYLLLSEDQAPAGSENFFTEKLYRLPGCQFCYQAPAYAPNLKDSPHCSRGYITFGTFNNIAKINGEVIALWSNILKSIPDSVLVLKWKSFKDSELQEVFSQKFTRYGIDQRRIKMRGYSPHESLLEEYQDIDIALDTFPFSGALTTCEALWMGVPVITLYQQRPVSRQSFSILKSIGLEELAARTPEDYLDTAISLAQNQDKLSFLRQDIRQRMVNNKAKSLAVNLEEAFKQMLNLIDAN